MSGLGYEGAITPDICLPRLREDALRSYELCWAAHSLFVMPAKADIFSVPTRKALNA